MLRILLITGGCLHFVLVAVGLAVPLVLDWSEDLQKIRPFLRRLFWTYGAFIVMANVGFGVITLAGVDEMLEGSSLGRAFAGFVSLYWIARLAVQYGYFDWSDFPSGPLHRAARYGLDMLFLFLVLVYGWTAIHPAAGSALLNRI